MDSNKLRVNIGGNSYTIISEKSNGEIEKIANYVDDEIKKITSNNYRLNPIMASTLVALNIAENLFDLKEEFEKISNNFEHTAENKDIDKKNLILLEENKKLKDNIDLLNLELKELIGIIENINNRYEVLEKLNTDNSKKVDLKNNEIIKLQKEIIALKEENIFIQKNLINKLNKI